MKHKYMKPIFHLETFDLVEHIAAGCNLESGNTPSHNTPWTCALTTSGNLVIFTTATSACASGQQFDLTNEYVEYDIDAVLDGQCYNTLTGGPMYSS